MAKVVGVVLRNPLQFSGAGALIDIDPALAIVSAGAVEAMPDASLSREPLGADLLDGAGAFDSLTGWTEDGDGLAEIVAGQLSIDTSPPVLTASVGTTIYVENAAAGVVDAAITVAATSTETADGAVVAITANLDAANDALSIVDQLGVTGEYDDGTGVLTLTGVGVSLANWQTVLRAVKFATSGNAPSAATRTVSFTLDNSNTATKSVAVTAVNDAPTIVTSGGSTTHTGFNGAVVIDASLTVADDDDTNIESATVQITTGYVNGDDVLAGTNQNGITFAAFNAGTGTLSASGSATKAHYQAALRGVTFDCDAPAAGSRVVTFTVNDGSLASTGATKGITTNDGFGASEGATVFTFMAGLPTPADTGKIGDDGNDPHNFKLEATPGGAAALLASFVTDADELQTDRVVLVGGTTGTMYGGVVSIEDHLDGTFTINTFIYDVQTGHAASSAHLTFVDGETVTVSRRPKL